MAAAGTIIRTPDISAEDWTDWIVQQGKTDKGFLRMSLTNPASTVASLIATGSVMECAGSIYVFEETDITLADECASADVAFYYTVVPSGGGTTATVVMRASAPTWVSAKQGFYDAADGTTRYIGGGYMNATGGFENKFIYTPQMLDYLIYQDETRPKIVKDLELGEWNMDTTALHTINSGLTGDRAKSIKVISMIIKRDDEDFYYTMPTAGEADGDNIDGGFVDNININTGVISIRRKTGGRFDNTSFNATASTLANRGWLTIEYTR